MRHTVAAATYSKDPSRYAKGVPETLDWAYGAHVGVAGQPGWVDLTSGLGAVILGHGYPTDGAIRDQLPDGISFPLPTKLEETVAAKLCEHLQPWKGAEQVRFSKNGRDAVVAAVRLARAVTGKLEVRYCDYHGADDLFLGSPPWNGGVVSECTTRVTRDELMQDGHRWLSNAACILLEPVSSNAPEELHSREFFEELRAKCDEAGCLLILDEMVSFGRAPGGSAVRWLGIQPDLWVGGKCMANGMPLTAVVGPEKYMRRFAVDVFHSMTHAGEALSLAAADATLDILKAKDIPTEVGAIGLMIAGLFSQRGRYEELAAAYPTRLLFPKMTEEQKDVLFRNNVLCAGYANLTLAHAEDSRALDTIMAAFSVMLAP